MKRFFFFLAIACLFAAACGGALRSSSVVIAELKTELADPNGPIGIGCAAGIHSVSLARTAADARARADLAKKVAPQNGTTRRRQVGNTTITTSSWSGTLVGVSVDRYVTRDGVWCARARPMNFANNLNVNF